MQASCWGFGLQWYLFCVLRVHLFFVSFVFCFVGTLRWAFGCLFVVCFFVCLARLFVFVFVCINPMVPV